MKRAVLVMVILTVMVIPSVSMADFGALAYSPSTGRCEGAFGYDSAEDALYAAQANCGYRDCVGMAWFENSCGALAMASNGEISSSHGRSSEVIARESAIYECYRKGSGCRVICWACSGNQHNNRRNRWR